MSAETFLDGRVTMLLGDVREMLKTLPDDHFDCVVTSPPYWGLRSYLPNDHDDKPLEIGLEPTLGEHLAVLVAVFAEVRRVMKPTATLWLNYGDCYATAPNGRSAADTKISGNDDRTFRDKPFSTIGPIDRGKRDSGRWGGGNNPAGGMLKPKDLCMVPNRLAIALQDDGWFVRSEIVWGKTNPMPDSVKDRPGTAHEKIFLLSKAPRYHYDAEAVRFNLSPKTLTTYGTVRNDTGEDGAGKVKKANFAKSIPIRGPRTHPAGRMDPRHEGHINHTGINETPSGEGRGLRNYEPAALEVWPMATHPFGEAHFATFPPELALRCLKAGCPPRGKVLDPFGGAGTVSMVAALNGLASTLIELNEESAIIARARIEAAFMGREEGSRHMTKQLGRLAADAGPLFANPEASE
jgi:DNA modification methylase